MFTMRTLKDYRRMRMFTLRTLEDYRRMRVWWWFWGRVCVCVCVCVRVCGGWGGGGGTEMKLRETSLQVFFLGLKEGKHLSLSDTDTVDLFF